jgi:UDP-N-acetylglucosamine--N-acetylmuramyl-(pentapeptide) pyrophosphoryl-undecaprenol N-acetylglucosamine transferase
VYPSLSVAAELQRDAGTSVLYVGREDGIEKILSQHAQIPFQAVEAGAIRGLGAIAAAANLARLPSAVARVRAIIRDFRPNAAFATGGYVSAPVIWACAIERIPSVLYLPDLEPGWAVRATERWATRIAVSLPEVTRFFSKSKVLVTGYPVRQRFYSTDRVPARERFQLDPNAHVVTIFGGSRGARSINEAVAKNLAELARMAQLVLITGREDEMWMKDRVQQLSVESRVRVFGYLDDEFVDALAAADVIVSRAGAAILGEFPALGVPTILVPYPYAGKHQKQNARFMAQAGAAIEIENDGLSQSLQPALQGLLNNPTKLTAMRQASRRLAVPNAAANIAALLSTLAGVNDSSPVRGEAG